MFSCICIEPYTRDSDCGFTTISAHLSDRNLKATRPCTAGAPPTILLLDKPTHETQSSFLGSGKTPLLAGPAGAPCARWGQAAEQRAWGLR